MIKKFTEYIKEYNGPGRTAGFRYSEPKTNVVIQFIISLLDNISIDEVKNVISENLKKMDVKLEDIKTNCLDQKKNLHTMHISIICYSENEASSIFKEVEKELTKKYPLSFIIDKVSIL